MQTKQDDANYIFELINISILVVDSDYQRNVSELKVKNIIKNFSINAFGTIFVNIREDGNYYLVDGQHRVSAAKQMGYKKIPAMITQGLSKAQEAELFLNYQTNRNMPTANAKFKAKIIAKDKKALDIVDILNKNNLKPLLHCSGTKEYREKGRIGSIGSLEKVYNYDSGKIYLNKTLEIITESWKIKDNCYEPEALVSDTIQGIGYFLYKTYKYIDIEKLIKKLKKITPEQLIREQNRNLIVYGKGKAPNYARALLEVYNHRTVKKILNINF